MNFISDIKRKKTPMRRKLFFYMLALVIIVLAFLSVGLFFIDNFSSTKETTSKDLSFQLDVFERQVNKYYDDLTMMGTSLSNDVGEITERYLTQNGVEFSDVNDNLELVTGLQRAIFDKLREELLKTDCSGAFVVYDATVNTSVENAEYSKTGLYFQRSTLDATDESVLLFRGIAEIGRENGIMPHRKWRLEFSTDYIYGWNDFSTWLNLSTEKPTFLLDVSTLQGTSERAMHFFMPITGNGISYGFCGFEISESYFKKNFAQASQIKHLTCMLTKKQDGIIDPATGFSAGVYDGYNLTPNGVMTVKPFGNGLIALNGNSSYIGKSADITICNANYSLTVALPREEYDDLATKNAFDLICLLLLILCFMVTVCVFFSRKFLAPLLKGLDLIRKNEHRNGSSNIVEIDDLLVFLTEQDRLREEQADEIQKERELQKDALNKANDKIERLTYSRKNEVDPEDYETFKLGIKELTKTEKTIFKLYLDGKTAEEILEICSIRQSTLKYHNHNILGELGVSSRKQMLRYATLLAQESGEI